MYTNSSNWPIYNAFFCFSGVAILEQKVLQKYCVNIYPLKHEMDSDCSETSLNGLLTFRTSKNMYYNIKSDINVRKYACFNIASPSWTPY